MYTFIFFIFILQKLIYHTLLTHLLSYKSIIYLYNNHFSLQALGDAQSEFKILYDQRIVEFKEQLSIARAAFELELSVKIEEFHEALRAAIARRAQGKIIYSLISSSKRGEAYFNFLTNIIYALI